MKRPAGPELVGCGRWPDLIHAIAAYLSPHHSPDFPDEERWVPRASCFAAGATVGCLRSTVRPLPGLGPGDRTTEREACVSLTLRPRGSSTRQYTLHCSRRRAPKNKNTVGVKPSSSTELQHLIRTSLSVFTAITPMTFSWSQPWSDRGNGR